MPASAPQHRRFVQATVPPLSVSGIPAAVTGTIAFALASALLAWQRPALVRDGHELWLWVALTGTALGLALLAYFVVRRRAWAKPQG